MGSDKVPRSRGISDYYFQSSLDTDGRRGLSGECLANRNRQHLFNRWHVESRKWVCLCGRERFGPK